MRDFPQSFQHASGVVVDLDQSRGLNVKVNGRDARYEVRERLQPDGARRDQRERGKPGS